MMELIVAYLFYWNVTCLIFCLHYILTTDLPWIKYAKMPRWKKGEQIIFFALIWDFLFCSCIFQKVSEIDAWAISIPYEFGCVTAL